MNPLHIRMPSMIINKSPAIPSVFVSIAIAIVCTCSLACDAAACQVPVFRYALERWIPDQYEVVVLNEGAMIAADLKTLDEFRAMGDDRALAKPHPIMTSNANLTVRTIDVSATGSQAWKKLWREHGEGNQSCKAVIVDERIMQENLRFP